GDFAATPVTCSLTTPIAANSSCTINVTFTPTALGARTGTLTVLTGSSAYPSLTAALTGTGAAVASTLVTLTPTTANFGSINQGSTSTAQTFTITNTAPTSLTIGSFSVSGDFAATLNTCSLSTPLAGGASCTINVTFTPTATGARAGALTVLTSSIYYPALTATLTGTGLATTTPSYTLTSTPPTSSVTVSAGSPANIVLTVTPVNGYTGTVTVNCVGLNVTGVACPGKSVNLGAATPLTLTITTTSRVLGAGIGLLDLHRPWMLTLVILFGLVLAMLLFGARNHRLLRGAGLFALLFALLAAGNGCGKGGSAPVSTTNPNGTPAGQYTFSITATDGVTANTKTLPYTLIVQ
ncbi:MAG TPA: choice-of-anchor D domain-containing protein, partial [Acidobacteriaceae bacterium]